jgi:RNA polymerase sigma-70 factor (ECF subfamily)
MDEKEAISRLKRRDIGGLEFLVQSYQAQAVQAAYLITHNRSQAEDIVQDSFLRVYERIRQFDTTRPFKPWFMRIVVNGAIAAAQREIKVLKDSSPDGDENGNNESFLELISDPAGGPGAEIEMGELRESILSALSRLPPSQRAAVVMRYYLGMDEAEMVVKMACPPGTIKWRLHAARKFLRALLTRWIELWPRIGSQVSAIVSRRSRAARSQIIIGIAVVMAIGILGFVSPVHGMLKAMWQQLNLVFINPERYNQEFPTQAIQEMVVPTVIGDSPSVHSLAELQQQSPVKVPLPEYLPEGLQFFGGKVSEVNGEMTIGLEYRLAGQPLTVESPILSLEIGPTAPFLVPDSHGQAVEVRGHPGTYFHGGWMDNGQGDPSTALRNGLMWDDTEDTAYLSWEEDGRPYLLFADELGLQLPDMLRIAESIQ